jgi:hypothetical protein
VNLIDGGLAHDMVIDGGSYNDGKKIVGVVQPKRENSLGTIYIKDDKVFVAYFDGNKINDKEIDEEIQSFKDLKKILTKHLLKDRRESSYNGW